MEPFFRAAATKPAQGRSGRMIQPRSPLRPSPQRQLAALGAALALFAAAPAWAQDDDPGEERERSGRWLVTIGGGARVNPEYPGADGLDVGPMPIFNFRREGAPLPFEAPDEGSGFGILRILGEDNAFDFGPAIQFQGKRRQDDVGAPVGDVGFTVEVGGFAEVFVAESFRLRGEMRRGIGGHEAWLGDLYADFVLRDDDSYVFSIGPRARWASNRWHDSYFGVRTAAPNLPLYDPDGGIYAYGVTAGLTHMLGSNVGLYGHAGIDRLVGDAADSPIVSNFGSRNQYSAGLGLFYTFTVGGR